MGLIYPPRRVINSLTKQNSQYLALLGGYLRPTNSEHMKVVVKKVPGIRTDKALDAVTQLVNVLGAGSLPEEAAPKNVEA